MKVLTEIKGAVTLWIDSVARTLIMMVDRVAAPRRLQLVEQDDGAFRIEPAAAASATIPPIRIADGHILGGLPPALGPLIKGSRVELVLQPKRFLFRPLELPRRAGEFLDGIVRAQIDRLTPWTVQEAVFGCTRPVDIANDRIVLTVAATARAAVTPYVQALAEFGAQTVSLSTPFAAPDAALASIQIVEQTGRGAGNLPRLRHALLAALLIAAALTAVVTASAAIVESRLQRERAEVARHISAQRIAMRAGSNLPSGMAAAQSTLALRKRETLSSVIVLEALSRALPDNTYLSELRMQGNKLQIVGMTRNAPALIPLIEQSSHFTHAAFFAPTTQAANDPRERFHIETRVQPVFAPGT
jgi:general secretion pathway protein L